MSIEMWCEMQTGLNTTMFPTDLYPAVPSNFKLSADPSASSLSSPAATATWSALVALTTFAVAVAVNLL